MGIQESGWDPLILVALAFCFHHNLLLTIQNKKAPNFRFKGRFSVFRHLKLLVGCLRGVYKVSKEGYLTLFGCSGFVLHLVC